MDPNPNRFSDPQRLVLDAVESYLKDHNQGDIGVALLNGFIDRIAAAGIASFESIMGALGMAFTDLLGAPPSIPQAKPRSSGKYVPVENANGVIIYKRER